MNNILTALVACLILLAGMYYLVELSPAQFNEYLIERARIISLGYSTTMNHPYRVYWMPMFIVTTGAAMLFIAATNKNGCEQK